MSPKEPEPIFLINLYLPPTMNSLFAIDIANDAMSLLTSVCLFSHLHTPLFPCATLYEDLYTVGFTGRISVSQGHRSRNKIVLTCHGRTVHWRHGKSHRQRADIFPLAVNTHTKSND
ncbi:hypothetical protein ALC62_13528 [Cyphomyrmex costatus]|uniref:Uncharacterized protein n=1 Tax=Cyphomyrmex costatus TaxID=456900 RepID=A0A151I9R9_9HYME|nr:hypothetical protein ALC62_13528 [Cyphomyrmex costatus]